MVISSEFTGDSKELEAQSKGNLMLVLIKTLNEECRREGQARELMSKVCTRTLICLCLALACHYFG